MRVGRVGWDAVGWEARMWVGGATSLCPICVAVANVDGSTSPAWSFPYVASSTQLTCTRRFFNHNLSTGEAESMRGSQDIEVVREVYTNGRRSTCHTLLTPLCCAGCKDLHVKCRMWADAGECEANPNYMLVGVYVWD
jgi:hypothetical protein